MNLEILEDLRKLLDYVAHDEERHFEECEEDEKKDHIYNSINRLVVWEYANRKGYHND